MRNISEKAVDKIKTRILFTTGPTALLPPRSDGKPEAPTAVDRLLMMGKRMPETC
jgi:hypothetical protein